MDNDKKASIAFLQPLIPHYREFLFKSLMKEIPIDLYIYKKQNVKKLKVNYVRSLYILKIFILYSIFPFLKYKYKILILPGEIRSISTWILLLTKIMHRKKIVLWGHGISIRNYLKEEKKYPFVKKFFHGLADEIWVYTDKEKEILKANLMGKRIIPLNNTINSKKIRILDTQKNKLKEKYNISTKINFIYCARFIKIERRNDLFLEFIKKVDARKYGFIIIGDGPLKPDFKSFNNVYDFGAIYDQKIKDELFAIADLYLQMGWVGLSIVEALLYGKPVLTLKRSNSIKQCVEYFYVIDNYNGVIAQNVDQLVHYVNTITEKELKRLQKNAIDYSKKNLKMELMIRKIKNRLEALNDF